MITFGYLLSTLGVRATLFHVVVEIVLEAPGLGCRESKLSMLYRVFILVVL